MFPVTQFYVVCGDILNGKMSFTLCLSKPRQYAEAVLQTYELLTYGDIHYIITSFCENVLTITLHSVY